MNKKQRRFCKLMATNIYTPANAVSAVWGDKYEDDALAGAHLLSKKSIVERIKLDTSSTEALVEGADASWVKSKLVELVEASHINGVLYDPNVVRYSLDMINKMNGNYEKDNIQSADVQLVMKF